MTIKPIDVLVVGAGPAGLTMAIELTRRGVNARVVDASSGPNTETRALGVQARTLELFEKLGVADTAIAKGLQVSRFNVLSENHRILRLDLSGLDSAYPFLLMLPQNETEAILAARLAELGGTIERQVELVNFTQHPDEVEAELRHADGTMEQTRAGWLIGADGAHSTVRRQLGLMFEGDSFEESFAVADLSIDWSLPYDELFAFLNRGDFMAYFPMRGRRHRVAVAYARRHIPDGEVTREELQKAVGRCGPPGARIIEIEQARRFHINQRHVEQNAAGRVFLVGDAAHIHSVVGAQGMNTGIQDAINLGWKLALVVHGQAPRKLLDTYAAERGPVARRLVKGTRRITRMTLLHNPIATAARRNIAPRVLGRSKVKNILGRALAQIDVSYHQAQADSHTPGSGAPRVGDRAPDVPVRTTTKETRLHEILDPVAHTLLIFHPANPSGQKWNELQRLGKSYQDVMFPLSVVTGRTPPALDPQSIISPPGDELRERYGIGDHGVVLIRPDGYLGFQSDGVDLSGLIHHLEQVFGPREDS